MPECFAASCSDAATVILEYIEPGTPRTTKPACKYHEDFERIHDPVNVRVAERI